MRTAARVSPAGRGRRPYNHLRAFYRRPTPETWQCALRTLYNCADIAVDHASFMFRMHGYDFGAISITMNRTLGLLQGYLETGDPYLARDCRERRDVLRGDGPLELAASLIRP
jgi:hypothetical protein